MIREARCQLMAVPDPLIGGCQPHDATVRRDRTTADSADNFATARASELNLCLVTVCRHRGASPEETEFFVTDALSLSRNSDHTYSRESFSGDLQILGDAETALGRD